MILMHRTCPACREKLTTNDHFFCGSCGSVLETSLIVNIDASKKVIDLDKIAHQKAKVPKKKITQVAKEVIELANLRGVVTLLTVFGLIGIPTYIFLSGLQGDLLRNFTQTRAPRPAVNITVPSAVSQTTDSIKSISLVSSMLGNQALMSYVPYNVDIFVESGDAYNLLKMLEATDGYYKELHNILSPIVLEHFTAFVEVRPTGFRWSAVFQIKPNVDLSDTALPEKYSWLYLKKTGNFLILSNNPQLTEDSILTASGLEKNINMNPAYVQIRNKVAIAGKMSVVALTGEGKDMLSSSSAPEIPKDLAKIISTHFKDNNNYLVIRD